MTYNEILAERIRKVFIDEEISFKEKKMMGGLTFMVNDKMCVGVSKDDLMARIDPEKYSEALEKKGCREMDFTGRPMKGFVFVEPDGTDFNKDLEYWIKLALEYNPTAKASKKKRERS